MLQASECVLSYRFHAHTLQYSHSTHWCWTIELVLLQVAKDPHSPIHQTDTVPNCCDNDESRVDTVNDLPLFRVAVYLVDINIIDRSMPYLLACNGGGHA